MTDTGLAKETELEEIGFPAQAIDAGRRAREAGLFASDPPSGLVDRIIAACRVRIARRTPDEVKTSAPEHMK